MFKPSKHEVIHSLWFKNIQLRNSQQNLNLKSTNLRKTRDFFCVFRQTDINKLNWRFNHIFLVITNRDFYCMISCKFSKLYHPSKSVKITRFSIWSSNSTKDFCNHLMIRASFKTETQPWIFPLFSMLPMQPRNPASYKYQHQDAWNSSTSLTYCGPVEWFERNKIDSSMSWRLWFLFYTTEMVQNGLQHLDHTHQIKRKSLLYATTWILLQQLPCFLKKLINQIILYQQGQRLEVNIQNLKSIIDFSVMKIAVIV